jgi:hypothetical protein
MHRKTGKRVSIGYARADDVANSFLPAIHSRRRTYKPDRKTDILPQL